MQLTDESKMPYGAHAGKNMEDVPAEYLIWLYDNNKCNGAVKEYIEDNLDVLRHEIKGKRKDD